MESKKLLEKSGVNLMKVSKWCEYISKKIELDSKEVLQQIQSRAHVLMINHYISFPIS